VLGRFQAPRRAADSGGAPAGLAAAPPADRRAHGGLTGSGWGGVGGHSSGAGRNPDALRNDRL